MPNVDNITVNTQSSIRIEGSKILYFDPYKITNVTSDADMIFITHSHPDHFEESSIKAVVKKDTLIIAPESMKAAVLSAKLALDSNCHFYSIGEEAVFDHIKIKTVAAYNNLKPFHPKGKKFLGYVILMDGITYYVAGDTDMNKDNRNVKCDVAIVPIGGGFTMDKKQAAEFMSIIKPSVAVPTHYGSMVGSPKDGEAFKELVNKVDSDIRVEIKLSNN